MAHENGDKQRLAKRRHVQGMLDETDPLIVVFTWGTSRIRSHLDLLSIPTWDCFKVILFGSDPKEVSCERVRSDPHRRTGIDVRKLKSC